jgi:hypothetical protein
MDAGIAPDSQESHVALRLFQRLGFSTDDPDAWAALPDPVPMYRTGSTEGVSWTTDLEIAEANAALTKTTVLAGIAEKADVLAFTTGRGESEVIIRPNWMRTV